MTDHIEDTDNGNGMKMPYAELSQYASTLEFDLDAAKCRIAYLQDKVRKFSTLGWNEARGAKLRRLETFYSRFINIMNSSDSKAPSDIVVTLKDLSALELKYLPETDWNDITAAKKSEA